MTHLIYTTILLTYLILITNANELYKEKNLNSSNESVISQKDGQGVEGKKN